MDSANACAQMNWNDDSSRAWTPRPRPRAELLNVLMLPDFERADRIGEFWGYPESRTFAELLIDLEEDKAALAVVFGSLAEMERKYRVGQLPAARLRPEQIDLHVRRCQDVPIDPVHFERDRDPVPRPV
jgi:hypothetical protein